MKKGFTLVELSIVLVIIGMLVGGILVGQSLIESAKLNSFIRQLQQYDVAIGTFKSKYKSLPGDSRYFGGNGDNDIIASEQDNFFFNLSIIGLKRPEGGSYTNTNTYVPGLTYPKSVLNKSAIVLPLRGLYVVSGAVAGQNYYQIGTWVGYTTHGPTGAATQQQALAVDSKLDDGKPTTGNVLYGDWYGLGCFNINSTPVEGACAFQIRMGSQTGSLY